MDNAITIIVILLQLLFTAPGFKSDDVLYPWGSSAGDNQTCSSDPTNAYAKDDPFHITLQSGLPFFGVTYSQFYLSPNGFLSDTAYSGLVSGSTRKRFPLAVANSTWTNCNSTAEANCWLNFYYDASVWEPLVSNQNDSDVCVNGKSVADNFDYDYSAWQTGASAVQGTDYVFLTDTPGCVKATVPPNNFPNWMIAAYWEEMDVSVVPAALYFRETDDVSILSMAKTDVERLSTVSSFNPQWTIVITWYYLTYSLGWQYKIAPENTVQLVIATDGTNTYGIYNFNQTELGGGTVGFDSGDGTDYCSLASSRTGGIKYVSTRSNVCVTGRWVLPFSSSFDKTLCEPLRTEGVSCECDDGWTGKLCAASIDDCACDPCPNTSSCEDRHMSYTCVPEAPSASLSSAEIAGIVVGSILALCIILLLILLIIYLIKRKAKNDTKVDPSKEAPTGPTLAAID